MFHQKKKQKTSPWYRCPTRGCDCRAIKCDFAEESILKAMKEWLAEYTVNIETEKTIQVDPVETALKVVREQLTETQLQQDKFANIWRNVSIQSKCLPSAMIL